MALATQEAEVPPAKDYGAMQIVKPKAIQVVLCTGCLLSYDPNLETQDEDEGTSSDMEDEDEGTSSDMEFIGLVTWKHSSQNSRTELGTVIQLASLKSSTT